MKLWLAPALVLFMLVPASAARERSNGAEPKADNEDHRVKKLIESMRSGKYSEDEFPRLDLTDVPALLEYADGTRMLKTFPRNLESSQLSPECSEGMVALWLIEGIRQGSKYPSLNALCFKAGVDRRDKDWASESEDNHQEVAKAYRTWWEKAKSLPPEKARAIQPLKDTLLRWY